MMKMFKSPGTEKSVKKSQLVVMKNQQESQAQSLSCQMSQMWRRWWTLTWLVLSNCGMTQLFCVARSSVNMILFNSN